MSIWLTTFRKLISPPVFQDEELTRRARIVHSIYIAIVLASIITIAADYGRNSTRLIVAAGTVISLIGYWLNTRGYPQAGGFVLLVIFLSVLIALLLVGNGIHDIAITALPVLLILSALMLERRGVFIFAVLEIAATGFVVYADISRLASFDIQTPSFTSFSDFFIIASILSIAAISSHILVNQLIFSLNHTRLSEARLRALVENSPDFILEINRAGEILFINRLAETYLGKNVRDVLPADQVSHAIEGIEKAFVSGEPQSLELQTITQEGRMNWNSIRVGPVKQGKETTSLTLIVTEITAQKLAEESLQKSEANYRGAIIAAGFVPYSIDYQKKKFTFIGEDVYKLTGYTADEITPALLKERIQEEYLWGPNANMSANEARQKIISGIPLEWRQDMLIHTKTGENRWLSDTSIEVLDATGKAIGGIGIVQDITERKQAEAEREKLFNELAAQNAELERFNYTISHELKSPLVTIKGFLGSIEMDFRNSNFEKAKNDLGRIVNAADKMEATISDLLELSRVGRVINTFEDVDLSILVKEALEATNGRIRQNNISVNVSSNLPVVFADKVRLREVFENLIDNAAKYTGGQLNPMIKIGARDQASEQVIFVKDNGLGIEPQYVTKIFGLFEKLNPTSEGTGIGLALIKRIIEVHSGKVWVESKGLGQGSTFCFTIPRRPKNHDKG